MGKHGTVECFQSFDVHVLHRMGALREQLVSYPMVGFRWPGLVRLTANKWRVDVEFRGGAAQRSRLSGPNAISAAGVLGSSVSVAVDESESCTTQGHPYSADGALIFGTPHSAEVTKAAAISKR